MPGRVKKARDDVPLGSFSDIAFLLIIFFILVTTLDKKPGFTSEPPSGEKTESEKKEKTHTITIRDDRIYWNDSQVSVDKLQSQLDSLDLEKKKDEEDKLVMLEAVGAVKYGTYFKVMAAISDASGVPVIVQEED